MEPELHPASNSQRPISIECTPNQLGEFISNLLGRRQSITKNFSGNFTLDMDEIRQFYHLLEQRHTEQTTSHLIQFVLIIKYDDGSTIEAHSLEELEKHATIRPLISRGVFLSWTYIIKFPGKQSPEKQTVEIDINVINKQTNMFIDDEGFAATTIMGRPKLIKLKRHHTGIIDMKVSYTARTWGVDIENLLSNHIENFVSKREGQRSFISSRHNLVYFFNYAMTFIGMSSIAYWISQKVTGDIMIRYNEITKTDTAHLLSNKIDAVMNTMTSFSYLHSGAIAFV